MYHIVTSSLGNYGLGNEVMRGVLDVGNRGIIWDLTTRPENCDFADITFLMYLKEDITAQAESSSRVAKTVLA